jgi:carboxymethylenebutenolidase
MFSPRQLTAAFFCFLLLGAVTPAALASSIEGMAFSLPSKEGSISVERYAASGTNRRSSVVILHGRQGVEKLHDHYQRFAVALAEAGFDAYLVNYYIGDDSQRANNPDAEQRQANFSNRIHAWSKVVSTVMDSILLNDLASGRIALLGFSQGGYLATATAGLDSRVSALGVFYGGIPAAVKDEITRLPPLLELHGDADRTVSLENGRALVDLARTLGQQGELIIYPGAGHGFFGNDDKDSRQHTIDFFRRYL